MKYIAITILSIVWMITTLLLAISCIGILTFLILDDDDEMYWFTYGRKLLDEL